MQWQVIVASIIVLAAAAWLAWRCWRVFRRAMSGGPIGDCGHCPRGKESETATPLVQLGELAPARKSNTSEGTSQDGGCRDEVKRASADDG